MHAATSTPKSCVIAPIATQATRHGETYPPTGSRHVKDSSGCDRLCDRLTRKHCFRSRKQRHPHTPSVCTHRHSHTHHLYVPTVIHTHTICMYPPSFTHTPSVCTHRHPHTHHLYVPTVIHTHIICMYPPSSTHTQSVYIYTHHHPHTDTKPTHARRRRYLSC